ncbi:hypothetical protein [Maribacter sp. Hel_I_7]|uniref:hypothetical protein n=1 Tax=Maribacter sp. Hel_I_7 TaxID=1249997 RepID=UPI0012DC11B8|nr:hypothetical protein [Maribacter sp. Hel_I_7]
MSKNRRERRQTKKDRKPVVDGITKRDKVSCMLIFAAMFMVLFILYFLDAILYFFYLLFNT